jgi:transcriptional regulator with XRE-family HTH domain
MSDPAGDTSPVAKGSPSSAAADPAADIGVRVAAHRARQGMKVSELARRVGVSPSLISQIERGQSRPSVSTLFALSEALGVPVDAFFRDREEATPAAAPSSNGEAVEPARHRFVVRRGERAGIDIEGGVRWERLTPTQLDDLEFLELVYAPGAESNSALYRHPGMEMVVVLQGRLTIFVGFDRYDLAEHDSICFPSTIPHRYLNETDDVMRAVTVIVRDDSGAAYARS